MNKAVIAVIVIVILLGGGVIAYKAVHHFTKAPASSTSDNNAMKAQHPMPSTSMNASPSGGMDATGSAMDGAVKEIIVTGSNYKFEPSTLTVKKGDHVKVTFKNSGGFHNFVIDELNVKSKTIPASQTDTVEFTADTAGTYSYYCSVDNHRAMGMEGKLTIE